MEQDHLTEFETIVIGRYCSVKRREHVWVFDLGDGIVVTVESPWRIVSNGRIAFASEDDGQVFGLAEPMDGEFEAREFLGTKPIVQATVDRETADLSLHFESSTRLDVFNNSAGYEGWQAGYAAEGKRWLLIAQGGGTVAVIAQ